ncbi:DUF167 domain-containing protein [Mobilicoccus massiliensis]|uniref:DUF167 domain-containing protein n=1 Tax=Mobilicoccus massiliensis TaxID=1522310 RepID=UPI0005908E83|nr:DUF167 domain-containing protein [Mobilicoccus massiliensis]
MRIDIRVRPGASRTKVGGRYGEDTLVVAVTARPVDGSATQAAIDAVAAALGLRRRDVTLVTGATARSKVLELDVSPESHRAVTERLEALKGSREPNRGT